MSRESTEQAIMDDLQAEHDFLDEAAERWLEAKAAGKDTSAIDAEIDEHDAASRRLERRLRRRQRSHT